MNKDPQNPPNAGKSATQKMVRIPLGNLKIFNQHDTPPGLLFMQGSCIIEIQYLQGEAVPDNMSFEAFQAKLADMRPLRADQAEQPHIGHIKIVDGSGEMLYRFDNNNKESIEIALSLRSDDTPLGEFAFGIVKGELVLNIPGGTNIGSVKGDAAMNKERIRFRCLDSGSSGDIDISAIRVQKVTESGVIPIYSCIFRDLKKDGAELKVMLWLEPHEQAA